MASKWEYKRGLNLDNDQMKNLGDQGFELVNVFIVPDATLVGSDVRGPSIAPHVKPPVSVTGAIVSYWKRPI